jgi:hypothetical protein
METIRWGIKRIGLCIQSEYVKGKETNRRRYQAYRLRIGCVSKTESMVRSGSTRQTDRQTDFGLTMTVVSAPWKPPMVL